MYLDDAQIELERSLRFRYCPEQNYVFVFVRVLS